MQTSVTKREDIALLLNELNLVGTAVEVGVFRGEFARLLLERWKGRKLILVDPWRHLGDYLDSWNLSDEETEENYRITLSVLSEFKNRVDILRMKSEEAAPFVPDNSCDFIHIDANHSYEAVKRDLELWYPKLRAGGVMSGHDYFDAMADEHLEPIRTDESERLPKKVLTSYGVRSAVDEFVAPLNVTLSITSEHEPMWYFIKPPLPLS